MKSSRVDRVLQDWDLVSRGARRPDIPRRVTVSSIPLSGPTVAGMALVLIVLLTTGLWYRNVQRDEAAGTAPPALTADAWGPLAVVNAPDGFDDALTSGTLRVTEECVFLEGPGGHRSILVWPADRTVWKAQESTIKFDKLDGIVVTLRDGDTVTFGGGGDNDAESGISGEEWVRRTNWVAAPAPSCPISSRWSVADVIASS